MTHRLWSAALLTAFAAVSAVAGLPVTSTLADGYQTNAPDAPRTAVKVEIVAEGLEHPWGLAFLDNGDMLVTERPGRLRVVQTDGTISEPVSGLPAIAARGQGGLLDVAIPPDADPDAPDVYLTFSERRETFSSAIAVTAVRGRLVRDSGPPRLEDVRVIFRQEPTVSSGYHFGSRIVFADDGTVFITLGDRGRRDQAQELDRHWGKIVRVNRDGTVPKDNPFVTRAGVQPEIFSNGHRNVQGAALDRATGKLWTVEHGAAGGDEINQPRAGNNYGWPVISYGRHYSGGKIGVGRKQEGMEQPVYYWDPSIAPSGLAVYDGDLFDGWKGNLLVGALKFRHLARLVMKEGVVVAEERLLEDVDERIRAVVQGPEGAVYVLTDDPEGKVLRVVPG